MELDSTTDVIPDNKAVKIVSMYIRIFVSYCVLDINLLYTVICIECEYCVGLVFEPGSLCHADILRHIFRTVGLRFV